MKKLIEKSHFLPPHPPETPPAHLTPPRNPSPHLAPPQNQKLKSRGQPTECPCKKSLRSDEKRLKYSTFHNFVQNGDRRTDTRTD